MQTQTIEKNCPRILLGAASSGSGKTTVACAIVKALAKRGVKTASFKCGPDYIDPMFHRQALGTVSCNLDLFLLPEKACRTLLLQYGSDFSLLEGVMGYYDGVGGITTQASSYHLAKVTTSPAVLVVNCRGMSVSLGAQIQGFLQYERDSGIQGVIFNQLSPALYPEMRDLVQEKLGIRAYGFFPRMEECSLESRHLGLVTAEEVENLEEILERLGDQAEKTLDLDGLLELGKTAPPLQGEKSLLQEEEQGMFSQWRPRIGVARDRAFCFYYLESLALLEELGAELVAFSPLAEKGLPEDLDGLWLGGGYPELYAKELSQNKEMLRSVREALEKGIPCLAECGGFLYLHRLLEGSDGKKYEMAGFLQGESFRTPKLRRFGYGILTAQRDSWLCKTGEQFPVHEFHYWDSTDNGDLFHARKPLRKAEWDCMVQKKGLIGGYPHWNFCGSPQLAVRFLQEAVQYRRARACLQTAKSSKKKP